MSVVLGVNAVFHDPAAALVVDGEVAAAAEEERFSRRKHGKEPVAFSTWELPVRSAQWCLEHAGLAPGDLDAIAYSYDPGLAPAPGPDVTADEWEGLRTLYARRAPRFLATALPGLDPAIVRFVPHHVAHAASTALAAPLPDSAVLVCDGRGEARSHWAGRSHDGDLHELAAQPLPHSLGLMYEEATAHLGFRRSSDEYKVMALAAYGEPAWLPEFRDLVYPDGAGGFRVHPVDWNAFVKPVPPGGELAPEHANLAATVQLRLEEVLLDLARWLHGATGERALTMAGGVALNCVANSRLLREGPFDQIWVQPAAGDAGTALGAALYVAHELGDRCVPMLSAALGRGWSDDELAAWLASARVSYERPPDIAAAVAEELAADHVVGWFQGRSEYGPRALGHRSLLAHPGHAGNVERLNDIKGREQFRPVAPMVTLHRAAEVFGAGPVPSPYMLFTHQVSPAWRERLPAVTHVDGSARAQTVDPREEPLAARMLECFERLTGLPAVVNTSLNVAGRPIVDDPRDALELFGSAPLDALAIGPFLLRRPWPPSAAGDAADEAGSVASPHRAQALRGGWHMRILLWHVHGTWTTAFVQGGHDYLIPVLPGRPPEGRGRPARPGTFDWPANAAEVTPGQLRDAPIDVAIAQRPGDLDLIRQWTGRQPGAELPTVFLEHNTPSGAGGTRHPAAGLPGVPIVHVTHFNNLFWDCDGSRTVVIEHGIPDPGYRYTGELPAAAVVVNDPVRRGRAAGTDLLPAFRAAVPADIFGMGTEPLGGADLPHKRLLDELPRRRVYLHPFRWTSLGLSLIEAMHLGMPVAALATTEVPHAVPAEAGLVSTDVPALARWCAALVRDPGQARHMGKAGRRHALARYGLNRFLADWDQLLAESRC